MRGLLYENTQIVALEFAPGVMLFPSRYLSEPLRAMQGLTAADIRPRQLDLQWEPLDISLVRCETFTLSLCYRHSTPAGGRRGTTTATTSSVSACQFTNASHFTLSHLQPYSPVHVRLVLSNPKGRKESSEVTFRTEEDGE